MIVRVLFVVGCLALGAAVAAARALLPAFGSLSARVSSALVGAAFGAALGAAFLTAWRGLSQPAKETSKVTRAQNGLLFAAAGAACGFALHAAVGSLFPPSTALHVAQGVLLASCTLFGLGLGILSPTPFWHRPAAEGRGARGAARSQRSCKVLDTSVIIDGRVGDLLTTGFIEGEVLIPEFVLDELQGIADSADALRRKKGRRGLDILRQLMENESVAIRVVARDYPTIAEVDRKLIRLAKEERAALVTTDYNLNRVAQVEGIAILNVNELASAVKPRFVPGEQIDVEIIDRGAEINQGVGYLDDGTMIVVENGRRHIGRTIKATVKSTLQTEAGRMLFAEPANEPARWEKERETR
jgi:uncharacterized protein YacL